MFDDLNLLINILVWSLPCAIILWGHFWGIGSRIVELNVRYDLKDIIRNNHDIIQICIFAYNMQLSVRKNNNNEHNIMFSFEHARLVSCYLDIHSRWITTTCKKRPWNDRCHCDVHEFKRYTLTPQFTRAWSRTHMQANHLFL